MAIRINSVEQDDEGAYILDLAIHGGVYAKDHYRVRVVDVLRAPEGMSQDEQHEMLYAFVTKQVATHIRRGALPPPGVQINGSALFARHDEPWSDLAAPKDPETPVG